MNDKETPQDYRAFIDDKWVTIDCYDMEALMLDAVDDGRLKQCQRCQQWKLYTEIKGNYCEHCQ